MKKAFTRFDRLAFDLATARHNWNEHTLALVLTASVPGKDSDSISGVHTVSLTHKLVREGRVAAVAIDEVTVKADRRTIGPFAAAAVVNATTSAPICFIDLGKETTLEDGSSTVFKFPPDALIVTA